jgi:hypothetical protein
MSGFFYKQRMRIESLEKQLTKEQQSAKTLITELAAHHLQTQAERQLAALKCISETMAHQYRNPLHLILNFCRIGHKKNDQESFQMRLEELTLSLQKSLDKTIRQLDTSSAKFQKNNLEFLCQNALDTYHSQASLAQRPAKLTMKRRFSPLPRSVICSAKHMTQWLILSLDLWEELLGLTHTPPYQEELDNTVDIALTPFDHDYFSLTVLFKRPAEYVPPPSTSPLEIMEKLSQSLGATVMQAITNLHTAKMQITCPTAHTLKIKGEFPYVPLPQSSYLKAQRSAREN